LENLNVVVVRARNHRWPRVEAENAAFADAPILWPDSGPLPRDPRGGGPFLCGRRQRRNPSIRWIDNEGSPFRRNDLLAEVPPEIVVGALEVSIGRRSVADPPRNGRPVVL